jgi:hypothetical protein
MLQLMSAILVSASCGAPPNICAEMNVIKDISALVALAGASDRCPGISINTGKALDQAKDVAHVMANDAKGGNLIVNVIMAGLADYYANDEEQFCEDALQTLRSYSPEYLRWYGIVE